MTHTTRANETLDSVIRRVGLTMAALVALIAGVCGLTLPDATVALRVDVPSTTLMGAYHVHTKRSDGGGTVDDVARAAAAAGLQFVIITDHLTAANAALLPEPPAYRHGVLVIDAMEISTSEGHLVALGLQAPAPYPLGGDARDVVDDVRRLGGWTVAAHPDSPRTPLQWRGSAVDGLEWINADSEWRDNQPARLALAALHAIVRPAPAIASLFARPEPTLRRWDRWGRQRLVPGLAAVDAHARIGLREDDDDAAPPRTVLARPSYEDMFRTLVQAVWLEAPPTGDATADAARVLTALRTGRTYSAVAALASPAVLDVAVRGASMRVRVDGAPQASVSIWRDGRAIVSGSGEVETAASASGFYRVEVQWPGADIPWIVSAPLFVPGDAPRVPPTAPDAGAAPLAITRLSGDGPWTVEHHPATTAAWRAVDGATELSFSLARGSAPGQYAALVSPLNVTDSVQEIHFTVEADRPMRLSVQVRLPDNGGSGERWVRSVYADQTPRDVRVRLEDFTPAGRPTTRRPVAARAQSLLFVVDAPHTLPGAQGRFTVSAVSLHGPVTSER